MRGLKSPPSSALPQTHDESSGPGAKKSCAGSATLPNEEVRSREGALALVHSCFLIAVR